MFAKRPTCTWHRLAAKNSALTDIALYLRCRRCLAQHSACQTLTLPHTISASNTTHTLRQFAASLLPPELYTLQTTSLPAQVALLLCFCSDAHYFSSFPSHFLFIVPTILSHHLESSRTLPYPNALPSLSGRSLGFLEPRVPNPASIASTHSSLCATTCGALLPASAILISFLFLLPTLLAPD